MLNVRNIRIKQTKKFFNNKNYEFYKVIKIVNDHIYEFKLFNILLMTFEIN